MGRGVTSFAEQATVLPASLRDADLPRKGGGNPSEIASNSKYTRGVSPAAACAGHEDRAVRRLAQSAACAPPRGEPNGAEAPRPRPGLVPGDPAQAAQNPSRPRPPP